MQCVVSNGANLHSQVSILALRSEEGFGEIADAAGFPADVELQVVPTAKRKRTQSCWLTASVVNSTLGHDHVVGQQVSQRELTKRAFFHMLDTVHGKMVHRFGESNQALFQAIGKELANLFLNCLVLIKIHLLVSCQLQRNCVARNFSKIPL